MFIVAGTKGGKKVLAGDEIREVEGHILKSLLSCDKVFGFISNYKNTLLFLNLIGGEREVENK